MTAESGAAMGISIRRTTTILLAALLVATLAARAKSLVFEKRLREDRPAFTTAQARAYVKEMMPLVEQAAGRKFKRMPPFKVVRRKDLIPVLIQDMEPDYRRTFPQMSRAQIRASLRPNAEVTASYALGVFGPTTRTIYLLAGNFRPRLKAAKVEPRYFKPVTRLVIAHELTHALQDQEVNLAGQFQGMADKERGLAHSATIEGHAEYIENKVARMLKLDEAAKQSATALSVGLVTTPYPGYEEQNAQARRELRSRYIDGEKFIAWQYEHGGNERVWQVLAAPPARTAMIFHPETYSSEAGPIDYPAILKGLEQRFGKRKWMVQNTEIGELTLRTSFQGRDARSWNAIVPSIERVQMLYAMDRGDMIDISLAVVKQRSDVPALMSVLETEGKSNLGKAPRLGSKSEAPVISDFKGIEADAARKIIAKGSLAGSSGVATYVNIARGRVVVSIYVHGLTVTDEKIAEVAGEVFRRLPAELAGSLASSPTTNKAVEPGR